MKQTQEERAKQKAALKDKLRLFDRLLKETREGISKERETGPELAQTLDRQLTEAQAAYTELTKKEERAKRQSKKRKREIDEWKQWYNSLEQFDKTAEFRRLEQEIEWRSAEIAKAEARISSLIPKKLDLEGQAEGLKLQLSALKEGALSGPVDKDPRIKALTEERDELKRALSEMAK